MSQNSKGERLYSLVPEWNRTLTRTDLMTRATKAKVMVKTRQCLRRQLMEAAITSVNKKNPNMPRSERRKLARAYFAGAWMKKS